MKFLTMVAVGALFAGGAQAAALNTILFKLTDNVSSTLQSYSGWTTAGAVNEGVAGATVLENNGVDYRNALIDSNWGDFNTVRTSMYRDGAEVAYIEFDVSRTSSLDFFAKENVIGSSWTDLTPTKNYNYFSAAGHDSIGRHFFVNNNYGGCGSDVGHFVVLDRRVNGCSWEYTRVDDIGAPSTGFLYADATTQQNWTTGSVGVADTFVISTSYTSTPTPAPVPLPAPAALLLGGLAVFGAAARRKG